LTHELALESVGGFIIAIEYCLSTDRINEMEQAEIDSANEDLPFKP